MVCVSGRFELQPPTLYFELLLAIFFKFVSIQVLRPYHNVSNLAVWDFYTREDLSRGAPYDLDLDEGGMEQADAEGLGGSRRSIINASYHKVDQLQPSCFWALMQVDHGLGQGYGISSCIMSLGRKKNV